MVFKDITKFATGYKLFEMPVAFLQNGKYLI